MQNFTDSANGDVPLTLTWVGFLGVFFRWGSKITLPPPLPPTPPPPTPYPPHPLPPTPYPPTPLLPPTPCLKLVRVTLET